MTRKKEFEDQIGELELQDAKLETMKYYALADRARIEAWKIFGI